MMSNNGKNHGGTFMLGVLVGGIGAAVAGLLLAPQSGERTREQIREKADESGRRAERLQTKALAALEEGQHQLLKALEETKAAVEEAGAPPVLAETRPTEIVASPEAEVTEEV
jgi:gas vesicle protein